MRRNLRTRIAIKKAKDLIKEVGFTSPDSLSIEDLIWYCDGIPKREKLDNSLGRIVFGERRATITIDSRIEFEPKIKFIQAHELGHLLLHKKLEKNFFDTDKTLTEWLTKGGHEQEANIFASELIMPSNLFTNQIANQKIDINLIESCTTFFGVSKTAFFLKYVEYGNYPIALIYSENGIIKWVSITHDFVLSFIKIGTNVPFNTVTKEILKGAEVPDNPEIIDAVSWFPDDFEISKFKKWKFKELCFKTGKNSILTCIWER